MGTHYEGSKKEVKTLNAFIKLIRASESLGNRLSRQLAEQDLTISQFGVLEALFHLGPLNQKALGEKLLKSGGNITLVVDNLEKSGWVERQRNPQDRRSMLIHLTEEGEELVSSYFPQHLDNIMQEFKCLSNYELDQLAEMCKKIGLQDPSNK